MKPTCIIVPQCDHNTAHTGPAQSGNKYFKYFFSSLTPGNASNISGQFLPIILYHFYLLKCHENRPSFPGPDSAKV